MYGSETQDAHRSAMDNMAPITASMLHIGKPNSAGPLLGPHLMLMQPLLVAMASDPATGSAPGLVKDVL
jgi:hypothetical protein